MTLPTAEDIIRIHEIVIRSTGGSSGLRDAGALSLCAARPLTAFGGKDMYPSIHTKAAAILEGIAHNHPFVDGNKRTAFMTALYVLENNSYTSSFEIKDIEETMVRIVVEKLSIEEIAAWLEKNTSKI